jgi:hypothetical protein
MKNRRLFKLCLIIDNDKRCIDQLRLGAASGVDNGTRGIYFFDAFESRRSTYIGP